MKKSMIGMFSLFVLIYSNILFADNSIISPELERSVTAHIAATSKDSESIEALMRTMHTESPISMMIKTQMEQIFPVFDINVSLVEFSFVGMSGEYAIAQFKQKLEKVSGPAQFKSHINEQIVVFKQDLGQWKIWQLTMLDMDFL